MKRTSLELKKAILEVINDNIEHSYVDLERKVGSNWKTIRNHCKELEFFEALIISENKVKILNRGKYLLEKF